MPHPHAAALGCVCPSGDGICCVLGAALPAAGRAASACAAPRPGAQAVVAAAGGPAGGYDLLAAQPQSERGFAAACGSLEVDLIALDLSRRLPFRLKPALVRAALARGVHFEVGVRAGGGAAGGRARGAPCVVGRLGWRAREGALCLAPAASP